MRYHATTQTPIDGLVLGILLSESGTAVRSVDFLWDARPERAEGAISSLAQRVQRALDSYFTYAKCLDDVPLDLDGTAFQKRVWRALIQIPTSKTLSYGQLAHSLASSPRAVGGACRRNPIPILVPCHRVTAAKSLGGFSGATHGREVELKEWLIQHEQRCQSRRAESPGDGR